MTEQTEQPQAGMKTFGIIWAGQLVSLLGSSLTTFALSIWILQHTFNVTSYTMAVVMASLPGTLFAPIAGTLVDRWNRRLVLIFSDLVPGIITAVIAVLLYQDNLQLWHIYIAVALASLAQTFQWPAYMAAITMLVKKAQYGRVNGMLEFGQAATTIAAPALAGAAMMIIDIWVILIIDFATFLFAIGTLILVRIPQPPQSEEGKAAKGKFWKEVAFGWHYIAQRKGLLHLLLYFALVNLIMSALATALFPMVLGFGNELGVGTVMALTGVGMLIGGLLMTATGGPKVKIHGVLGAGFVYSFCFILIGLRPSLVMVGVGVVVWYIALPVMNACSGAIWMAKVQPDIQGRVFAMRRLVAQFTVPIGDFAAGPLADKVFNPMLLAGGVLAGSVGGVIGVGPGRGIAFMFIVMAAVPAIAAVIGYLNPQLRNVETFLPDHDVAKAGGEPAEAKEEIEEAREAAENTDTAAAADAAPAEG